MRDQAWSRDELVLACDLVARRGWQSLPPSDPDVIDLSRLLQQGPVPLSERSPKFRNPNSVARKSADFATRHPDYAGLPTKGGRLDLDVLEDFVASPQDMGRQAAAIRSAFASGAFVRDSPPPPGVSDDLAGGEEGGVLMSQHLRRERDRSLRGKKLEQVRRDGGALVCEVCGMDPSAVYQEHLRPESLLDVHHIRPLADSGPTTTYLRDLSVLCPTCHRAIHAARPWTTPQELRERMRGRSH